MGEEGSKWWQFWKKGGEVAKPFQEQTEEVPLETWQQRVTGSMNPEERQKRAKEEGRRQRGEEDTSQETHESPPVTVKDVQKRQSGG